MSTLLGSNSPIHFAMAVLSYCMLTRASVTSWIRTPKRNAEKGGHPKSRHMVGLGMDVAYDDPAPDEAWRKEMGQKLGLHVIVESDHDHLQPL